MSYNEFNYGIGYEYNNKTIESNWYTNYKAMIIADSYEKAFPFISIGREYRFEKLPIALSIDFFTGFKHLKKKYKQDKNGDFYVSSGKYKLIGGLAPSVKFFIKDFSMNLSYSPEVKISNKYIIMHPPAFYYLTFGYKF